MAPDQLDGSSVFARSPAERADDGITPDDVRDALLDLLAGSDEQVVISDRSFTHLDLSYRHVDGVAQHPVVFKRCSFETIDATHAKIDRPVRFESCSIDSATFEDCVFDGELTIDSSVVTGDCSLVDASCLDGIDCTATTFEGALEANEASFDDEAIFRDVTFSGPVTFWAAEFAGRSNEFEDHACFVDTVFEQQADFHQALFRFTTFAGAEFRGPALFEEATFRGDADFEAVVYRDDCQFNEVTFSHDTTFADAQFDGVGSFRGARFEGGERTTQDDCRFAGVTFGGGLDCHGAQFRTLSATGMVVEGEASFELATVEERATVTDARFCDDATFDRVVFGGDCSFDGVQFDSDVSFRDGVFGGTAAIRRAVTSFDQATFSTGATFDGAQIESVSFDRTTIHDTLSMRGVRITETITVNPAPLASRQLLDLTDGAIEDGSVIQPAGPWLTIDCTLASIGDLRFDAETDAHERRLLDFVRFCQTEFTEFDGAYFDFARHAAALERAHWTLHRFERPPNYEPAVKATPATIETTYLKAKEAASTTGYIKAAGEFRVKRQRFARAKQHALLRSSATPNRTRLLAVSRSIENLFLDFTCGYGMRLGRIILVFALAPLLPALLFTFGGESFATSAPQLDSVQALFTPAGLDTFYTNLYFSYITFLTIGYGGIGPEGTLARLTAGLEVYLSVVLGGLVLYAFVKRSEL